MTLLILTGKILKVTQPTQNFSVKMSGYESSSQNDNTKPDLHPDWTLEINFIQKTGKKSGKSGTVNF